MAEKRMFARSIVTSDAFITMSTAAQSLYFQLSMAADDEGAVNCPISIMRMIGVTEENLQELLDKKFIIKLESENNVYVIKHWNINNSIRTDRKHESTYKKQLTELKKRENGAYTSTNNTDIDTEETAECQPTDNQLTTNCQPNDTEETAECQPSIDKVSIDKVREDKDSAVEHIAGAQNLDSDSDSKTFVPETLIPNATTYAQKVFDILKSNELPCCRGNFITFIQRDFKIALEGIHELRLKPEEVFAALENYCKVIELKRQGLSWWESELTFFNLCSGRSKTILRFLPENFNLDDYRKSRSEPGTLPDDRIRLDVEEG